MEYRDRNVLVTGGTGALGTAVVAALIEAGASCHVPWLHEGEAQRFGYRDHKQVRLIGSVQLTDEAAVGRLFGGIQPSGHRSTLLAASPWRPWLRPTRPGSCNCSIPIW